MSALLITKTDVFETARQELHTLDLEDVAPAHSDMSSSDSRSPLQLACAMLAVIPMGYVGFGRPTAV